jgi:hypothetical protein
MPNPRTHAQMRDFLDLLDRDIGPIGEVPTQSRVIRPMSVGLMTRMKDLTQGVEVDLDAPLEGDVDL